MCLFLYVVNRFVERATGFDYQENIVITVGLNIALAVSLNIVNGMTGQFSLGHIGFYAIGAYIAAAMVTYGHDEFFAYLPLARTSPPISVLISAGAMIPTCIVSGLIAAGVGVLVGLPSLRLRGDYLAIITLGFAAIVQVIIRNIPAVNGATSFVGINDPHNTAQVIATPHLTSVFWVYLLAVITIWVSVAIRKSNHGLALLAIREDEVAAEAMGINTTRYKVFAFALSAFFTGIAGAMYALYEPSLSNSSFDYIRSIDTVVMIVLGGLGSISGAALSAVLLTLFPEMLRSVDQYRLAVYALLLILLMITRPQGIFGQNELSVAGVKQTWFSATNLFNKVFRRVNPKS